MRNLFIVFSLICISTRAQDTIRFSSGQIQAVKVTEISSLLVKYKKFDNLTGPVYSINKSDVLSIKYFGGQIDSFIIATRPAIVVETPSVAVIKNANKNKISCIGGKVFMNENQISIYELSDLINNTQDETGKRRMQDCYRQMKAHRDISTVSLVSGLVLGCLTVIGTSPIATGLTTDFLIPTDEGVSVAFVGIICGGAMRISGFAVSQVQRNKKKAKMREIASIYNGDYNFK